MPQNKIKNPTTVRWDYGDAASSHRIEAQLGLTVNLPGTITNPLVFTVIVSGCASTPTIVAWLTDGDGDKVFATVSPPPPPVTVTFPSLPQGEYTLTVQVQCGTQFIKQIQDIVLPAPS